MKSGVYILEHDTGFKNMKKELVNKYGDEETAKIWAKAGANLEELSGKYAHLPKDVKMHTDGNMFRNYLLVFPKYQV